MPCRYLFGITKIMIKAKTKTKTMTMTTTKTKTAYRDGKFEDEHEEKYENKCESIQDGKRVP